MKTKKINQKFFDEALSKVKNNPIYGKLGAYTCSTQDFYKAWGVDDIVNRKKFKTK